jgi:hypothetical protein
MIIVTICVKDGKDIIGRCIEHHLSSGADKIIASENIIEKFPEVEIIEHPTTSQGELITIMARLAFYMGATWVINIDAHDFCYNIKELYNFINSIAVVKLTCYDHLYHESFDPSKMPFWMKSNKLKLAHRSVHDVIISDNYEVRNCFGGKINTNKVWVRNYSGKDYISPEYLYDNMTQGKIHSTILC